MSNLQKEILGINEQTSKLANSGIDIILKSYKQSLEQVRNLIAKIYIKYAIDGVISVSQRQRYTILKQLEKQLIKQGTILGLVDVEHTTKILKEVYQESFYRTAYTIDKGVDIAINFAILKPEMIKAAVNMPIKNAMFSDRIWKNKDLLVNRVRQSVEQALTQGTSIDKLAREIKRDFGSSAYESKRLIHTEVARCQSIAQDEIYKQSGLVKQVMFDATLDQKTSKICQSYDGQIFDINSNYPKPPLHPNCRSAIIPVVDGWQPTRKRENIKGEDGKPIIDYTTYSEWKKSRGIE